MSLPVRLCEGSDERRLEQDIDDVQPVASGRTSGRDIVFAALRNKGQHDGDRQGAEAESIAMIYLGV